MSVQLISFNDSIDETAATLKAAVLNNLTLLNLVPANGKPITFKEFKERAHAEIYGRAGSGLYIVYIGLYKENCFSFWPHRGSTKAQALKFSYDQYRELLTGDLYTLAVRQTVWGNTGVTLSYTPMRVRGYK